MVNETLRLSEISLVYGDQTIVDNLSFSLKKGRILAFVGPNGAGKSSTMKIMAGLVFPTSGICLYNGSVVDSWQIKNHCGFLIESPDFYEHLSGIQNLVLLSKLSSALDNSIELIQKVGLYDERNKKVGAYSQGMKQRLGIAQALIGNPEVLILDEPFSGLDPEVKVTMKSLLADLAKKENKSIIISSHQLTDLEELCDDLLLINQGREHFYGQFDDMKDARRAVTYTFDRQIDNYDLAHIKYEIIRSGDHFAVLSLTETESTEMNNWFCENIAPPCKIEHANIIYTKYQEMF